MIRFLVFFLFFGSFPLETYSASSKAAILYNAIASPNATAEPLKNILWERELPGKARAAFFDVANNQVLVALEKTSGSEIITLSKKGEIQEASAPIGGAVKKIFSFQERIFVLTESELISFESGLKDRRKVADPKNASDFVFQSNGKGVSSEAGGIYPWTASERGLSGRSGLSGLSGLSREGKVLWPKPVRSFFFDTFDLFGVADDGTVWSVKGENAEKFRFPGGCQSVWKYDQFWICVKGDRVVWDKGRELTLPSKILSFAFGYQKESKDSFWVFALEDRPNRLFALSLPMFSESSISQGKERSSN